MKRIYFYLLCCLFLIPQWSKAQYKSTGKSFRGSFGITGGYSAIDIYDFERWLNHNGCSVTSSNFMNLGMEGFIVRNQIVAGFQYQYEGPATFTNQYAKTSPKNDKIGIFAGYDPMKDDDDKHVLITLGIGYCETSARFHSKPPLILEDPYIPDQLARLKQANFYVNPKILLLYARKIKLGIEAGASFYLFGNYQYGYDYTYYTNAYNSNGNNSRQSHTQFFRYRFDGVPNFGQIS